MNQQYGIITDHVFNEDQPCFRNEPVKIIRDEVFLFRCRRHTGQIISVRRDNLTIITMPSHLNTNPIAGKLFKLLSHHLSLTLNKLSPKASKQKEKSFINIKKHLIKLNSGRFSEKSKEKKAVMLQYISLHSNNLTYTDKSEMHFLFHLYEFIIAIDAECQNSFSVKRAIRNINEEVLSLVKLIIFLIWYRF